MKTLLVAHASADLYGASRMMRESVSAFMERGWRVVATVPEAGPLIAALERYGAQVQICPTPVLRKQHLGVAGVARLATEALRATRAGMGLLGDVRPDVAYINTLVIPLWLALARSRRIPTVCHVHEGESSARRPVRWALAAPPLLADRVVSNSAFTSSVLTEVVPRLAARCTVIYNGIAGPPEITPPRELLEPPVRLAYVGRLSERKGVQDAVDAVAELGARGVHAELDVVGAVFPGSEWIEQDLRARARAGHVGDRVHLRGFHRDVWSCFAKADIVLVPARVDEGFGNTVIEAALAARPSVTSHTSGLLEATDGFHATRMVPPAVPGAIASAIEEIIRDWTDLRLAALDDATRAAERYAPSRYRAAIADVLESVSLARAG